MVTLAAMYGHRRRHDMFRHGGMMMMMQLAYRIAQIPVKVRTRKHWRIPSAPAIGVSEPLVVPGVSCGCIQIGSLSCSRP